MKDDRLEQQFDEYFEGLNTPENITCDAKKYVAKKNRVMPKIVKFASVAASFVLVFAVALIVIFNKDFTADEAPKNEEAIITKYGDGDLSYTQADAYSLSSLDKSLKFIEQYAHSDKASVTGCTAGYSDGQLTLVKAEMSLADGLNRHDTQIYVEFTGDGYVYEQLTAYYDGTAGSYKGAEYYLTRETAENGEPVNKLYVNYGGVKYYFNVTSSDKDAYRKYLEKIVK